MEKCTGVVRPRLIQVETVFCHILHALMLCIFLACRIISSISNQYHIAMIECDSGTPTLRSYGSLMRGDKIQ